VCGAI